MSYVEVSLMVKYSALMIRFGGVLLLGLITSHFVKDSMDPAVVLGLFTSIAAGSVAHGMGISVTLGLKHLLLVVLFCLPFGFIGLLLGRLFYTHLAM
ncbi:hypothetical protein [Vibrio sp. Hal054]|uniref:hypothetical protein n=1 Tax=Vibrio sp. Hal054 TaxID=3035158 RepID=UPI00301B73D3